MADGNEQRDPEFEAVTSAAGKRLAEQMFSWARVAKEILEVWEGGEKSEE